MKNLIVLTTPRDIHDHLAGLWRSKPFRQSHADGGFVHDIVEQFATLPRLFCDCTDDRLERAHFCSWWGVMMNRSYDNAAIEDLYRLHEMFHAAFMPYFPGIGFDAFHRKMEDNELKASVCSEIRIYFELPALRELTFDHSIYADRFLHDPAMHTLWRSNKLVAIETLQEARRDVMFSKPEHEMDLPERWIRRFALQNRQWSTCWYDRYLDIESQMFAFQIRALNGDRSGAIAQHAAWIDGQASEDETDHVPFRNEAALFANIYWSNRRRYDDAVAQDNAGWSSTRTAGG
ncbi:hypothetical protein SSBR45G_25300 [Bradyrhizobium sp. SSBR45G]|uniref:hypothetical protein n=1 Tax=unclassified Bradyrhizobium TaxID=2631580 RepID=UPI00234295A8|nr:MULTISPECIES: hypothetical protein [unclassified Bradyrhizobium]GLH77622.1 hypothetical protein SSBR45G_25300 [Bradyrhizobium sp. SSBR45G]GLH84859.1 hypothetical protein SSBR45R_23190 [Bradyrhizobium sp. SSBR45R]